ncbi:TetR family transcriptional regulator C-terminal domain-containing protein, partial [Phenylobacterium sp. SCN 70-31]|uniref:TetR family transcriptional regulator C-terminal domain-containing protein n=1 Tax=Phenylobacterium sp. SCN 70-31 TaxID=1660129 RepID=UPI0025F11D7E
ICSSVNLDRFIRPSFGRADSSYSWLSFRGSRQSMRALYVIMGEALGAVPEIQKDIAQLNASIRGTVEGMIERGVRSGAFRKDVDPKAASVLIVASLRGVAMQVLTDSKAVDLNQIVPLLKRQVLLSLR